MSKMSELNIQVQEMLREGWTPSAIANALHIPLDWIMVVEDDYDSIEADNFFAEQQADMDAEMYGFR